MSISDSAQYANEYILILENLLCFVYNQFNTDLEIYCEDARHLTVKLSLLVGMLIGNCYILFSASLKLNIVDIWQRPKIWLIFIHNWNNAIPEFPINGFFLQNSFDSWSYIHSLFSSKHAEISIMSL